MARPRSGGDGSVGKVELLQALAVELVVPELQQRFLDAIAKGLAA